MFNQWNRVEISPKQLFYFSSFGQNIILKGNENKRMVMEEREREREREW